MNRHVYILHSGDGEPIKIGIARDVLSRCSAVRAASGRNLTLFFSIETTRAREIEAAAHLALKKNRTIGEWFDVDRETAKEVVVREARKIDPIALLPPSQRKFGPIRWALSGTMTVDPLTGGSIPFRPEIYEPMNFHYHLVEA